MLYAIIEKSLRMDYILNLCDYLLQYAQLRATSSIG